MELQHSFFNYIYFLPCIVFIGSTAGETFFLNQTIDSNRIVGGISLGPGPNTLPYQAGIYLFNPSAPQPAPLTHHCGGTLISPNIILTAAHCVVETGTNTPRNPATLKLFLGSNELRKGQLYHVGVIKVHPDYEPVYGRSDIGLLYPTSLIQLNENVKFAWLPGPVEPWLSMPLTISGWGNTAGGFQPKYLQAAGITVADKPTCYNAYFSAAGNYYAIDFSRQFCGGLGYPDICSGDSGGGAIYNFCATGFGPNIVVGIASRSFCRTSGTFYPGVYTKVAAFLPWILGNLWSG